MILIYLVFVLQIQKSSLFWYRCWPAWVHCPWFSLPGYSWGNTFWYLSWFLLFAVFTCEYFYILLSFQNFKWFFNFFFLLTYYWKNAFFSCYWKVLLFPLDLTIPCMKTPERYAFFSCNEDNLLLPHQKHYMATYLYPLSWGAGLRVFLWENC